MAVLLGCAVLDGLYKGGVLCLISNARGLKRLTSTIPVPRPSTPSLQKPWGGAPKFSTPHLGVPPAGTNQHERFPHCFAKQGKRSCKVTSWCLGMSVLSIRRLASTKT
jgi:hypothetical protein